MPEREGMIIFTLWYMVLAYNYYIAPLFDYGCKCKCKECLALTDSNSSIQDKPDSTEPSSPKVTSPKESHSPKNTGLELANALKAAAEASRQVAHDIEDLEDDIINTADKGPNKLVGEDFIPASPGIPAETPVDEPNFEEADDE